jgi:molecular chaperone GrpE
MGHRDELETTAPPQGEATPEPEARSAAEPAALEQQLAEARAEAQQNWDRYLRTAADLENLRRRSQQELERVQRFALERFAAELLGVKDSLELGLAAAAADSGVEALREGTAATLKLLASAFEKFGIVEIDPAGAPFDPTVHEAISVQSSNEVDSEQVLAVVQKGYILNGRLLRPARVVVVRPETAAKP